MKNYDKFFFFGFGQSAKYLVNNLERSKKKFTFSATNTKKTTRRTFGKKKYKFFKFKDNFYDKKIIKELIKSNYILISIPPQKNKDIVLRNFNKILKEKKFKKLIYLSATVFMEIIMENG